jgi:hypothetical protein
MHVGVAFIDRILAERPPAATAARLSAISQNLQLHTISLQMVTFVAELAWSKVLDERGIFPSWDEILFRLNLEAFTEPPNFDQRPIITAFGGLAQRLSNLLKAPTERSWAAWRGAQAPSSLFAVVASVLWAQSRLHGNDRRAGIPPTSAVVTALDLTLEFALIREMQERVAPSSDQAGRIFVVLPVLAIDGHAAPMAKPLWIRGEIPLPQRDTLPEAYLDLFSDIAWEVLEDSTTSALHDGPHIVHLAGCPLIPLPPTINAPVAGDPTRHLQIFHAVVIDEHASLQFSSAELFSSIFASSQAHATNMWTIPRLLRARPDGTERFWLGLGVQMNDPAIRHRLASYLLDRTGWGDPQFQQQKIHGMVVDREITNDNSCLFQWVGFDLIVDSPEALVTDLEHYCRHLEAGGTAKWPTPGMNCPVP